MSQQTQPQSPPAERPRPGQPTPDPQPLRSPWTPRYAQHHRATNPAPAWCCELAEFGDECDCAQWAAEVAAAFAAPVTWDWGRAA